MSVETNDKNEAVDFMKEHIEQQNKINQETQALLKQLLEKTQPPPSKKRKTDEKQTCSKTKDDDEVSIIHHNRGRSKAIGL